MDGGANPTVTINVSDNTPTYTVTAESTDDTMGSAAVTTEGTSFTAGTEVTIPCYYKVGQAVIDVYLNGERLLLSSDASGTDGHYREVGTANSISNKIKTTTDWALETGDVLDFVVRR